MREGGNSPALKTADPRRADAYHPALVLTGLGETDAALATLGEAAYASSIWLRMYGPHDPRLNALRGDSRFPDLLQRSAID